MDEQNNILDQTINTTLLYIEKILCNKKSKVYTIIKYSEKKIETNNDIKIPKVNII